MKTLSKIKSKGFLFFCLLILLNCFFLTKPFSLLWSTRDAPFYIIDGDIIYLLNGLKVLDHFQVYEIWSPAVPLYILVAIVNLIPKLIVKFLLGMNYGEFVTRHFKEFMFWHRILFFGIGTFAINLTATAVFRYTRLVLLGILAFLSLLSIRHFPDAFSLWQVDAETVSLLLLSIWAWWFLRALKLDDNGALNPSAFVAGLICAEKISNAPVIIVVALLAMARQSHVNKRDLVLKIGRLLFLSLLGFCVGVFPAMIQVFGNMFNYLRLPFYSGMYYTGNATFIDIKTAFETVTKMFRLNPYIYSFFAILLLSLPFILKKRKYIYIFFFLVFVCAIYLRFPAWRYMTSPAFIAIILSLSALSEYPKRIASIVAILVFFLLYVNLRLTSLLTPVFLERVGYSRNLERFIEEHPPRKARIWEYAWVSEMAAFFSNDHSGKYLSPWLEKSPPMGSLFPPYFKKVIFLHQGRELVFDLGQACWDQLFIQNKVLPRFLEQYPNAKFQKIDGTVMSIVTREDDCQVDPALLRKG